MAGNGQLPQSQKHSLKYKHNQTGGAFIELAETNREDYAPSSSAINQHNGERNESKSAEIVRTSDLVAAIGHLWDRAILPPVLKSKKDSYHDTINLKKANTFFYSTEEDHVDASTFAEGQDFSVSVIPASHSLPTLQASVKCLKVTQKVSFFEPGSSSSIYVNSLIWRLGKSDSSSPIESFKGTGHVSVENLHNSKDAQQLLSEITISRLKHIANSNVLDNMKNRDCCDTGQRNSTCSISRDEASQLTKNMSNVNADSLPETAEAINSLSVPSPKSVMDHLLQAVEDANEIGSSTSVSRLHVDHSANPLATDTVSHDKSQHNPTETHLPEGENFQQQVFFTKGKSNLEICSSKHEKPGFARQEHAFAGAFAGIFVSLCLHPVDTIKTVTQSCRSDPKSILDISRSIIADRGVTGLYRGIASNIAASAPISAVYTFTYESVKGALLPYFSKECHSLAHCVAGGSASIATSVIFTPSERIKQQMQVSSHYKSSWNALLGIVGKGGFSSLYAGWGAVLCRNVPHSVIKFYTYERLKQLMPSSLQSNGQRELLRPLICGGLAGSTAALFTTPFDVVKTRLQTQIPGSRKKCDGVLNTLVVIAKHEGFKGLYRGLTPRLVMYMTQGALFFASYESLKRLFSLEAVQGSAQHLI
ncbi:putative envelope ADP,ATP carrier protein, chloroplastic [Heracleum sosnowskyi]|uniref:Envelope ADP,ATP carrier protein, chloroplastic n=1 Tax=Heracleum sosnowskyi TaxID=360622 RepID=A0AAD8MJI2_9APIA|nr:putative envelope ADP,ATP carrier protein, chloroplastic [Heracleum sosnowskyi]